MRNSVKVNIKNSVNTPSRRIARGTVHPCARCDGTGSLYDLINGFKTCPTCKGRGKNRL